MPKERLLAFSDGVIAVFITIMVLEMKPPHSADFQALAEVWPVFLSYVLSFVYVAIYWNNHHHLFVTVERISGGVMLANMNLLFWLSLVPFTTAWLGENDFASVPTFVYGVSLISPAIAYSILQAVIIRFEGEGSKLARAVGFDLKGKASIVLYALGIAVSGVAPWAALVAYALVAVIWIVPDSRIERIGSASPPQA